MARRVAKRQKYSVKFEDPAVFRKGKTVEEMRAALDKNTEMVIWVEDNLPGDFAYLVEGRMTFSDQKAAALFRLHYG